jgi:hypothetical protein
MGLKHLDLVNTLYPFISIDEFQPKSGTDREVIVVAFYFKDDAPAKDFNTFVQRGSFDILDSEVSPNPDEEGRYLVFVEFERSKEFYPIFLKFIKDVENLTGDLEWEVKPYLSDHAYTLDDPNLAANVITEPGEYSPEADVKSDIEAHADTITTDNTDNQIEESFKYSGLESLTLREDCAIFTGSHRNVGATVLDFGKFERISEKYRLKTKAINLSPRSEVCCLESMLGEGWTVYDMHEVVAVENNRGELLLLNNIQFMY